MMFSPERLLEQAIALAVKCHSGQSRKYTVRGRRLPYVVHPIEVMKTVWVWGAGDPILLTAAVLHDVLEDSQVTCKQLAKDFGEETAEIVKELTHDPKVNGKADYLKQFATASVPALVVKLADRYCNVADCPFTAPDRVEAYLGKSAVLIDILQKRLPEISEKLGEEVGTAIASAFEKLQEAAKRPKRVFARRLRGNLHRARRHHNRPS